MFAMIPIFVLLFFFGMTTAEILANTSYQEHGITQAGDIGSESRMLAFSDICIFWAGQYPGMTGEYQTLPNGGGLYNGAYYYGSFGANPAGLNAAAPYPMNNAVFPIDWECLVSTNGAGGRNIAAVFPMNHTLAGYQGGVMPGGLSSLLSDSAQDQSWWIATLDATRSHIIGATGLASGSSQTMVNITPSIPTPALPPRPVLIRWITVDN